MSALAHNNSADNNRVTNISTGARVDYTLRFTKQAVLVVDESADEYAQVGTNLLAELNDARNAAFISCSRQLNDIQIRCRLFEQLFPGQLFDPEQALAVSIINTLKQQPQSLTFVLEHAQYLSLQLLHELCQLSEIANKSKLDIQVLLLATPQAGIMMANNRLLFDKKVSVINAVDGQLIPLSDNSFKVKASFFPLSIANKYLIGLLILVLVALSSIFYLYQQDSLMFSDLKQEVVAPEITSEMSVATELKVGSLDEITESSSEIELEQASSNEILQALVVDKTLEQQVIVAAPQDVMQALSLFKQNSDSLDKSTVKHIEAQAVVAEPSIESKPLAVSSAIEQSVYQPDYYLRDNIGFVIQFGAFLINDEQAFKQFTLQYPEQAQYGYIRELNGQELFVITSPRFNDKASAKSALIELPEALQASGVWIKPIAVINQEITAFNQRKAE